MVVAGISTAGQIYLRRKDNLREKVNEVVEKVDLIGKGTAQGLKSDLQQLHERQQANIADGNWSDDIDTVFRESYVAYKALGGNSIIDRLKHDMDIWNERYASDSYGGGNK